MTTSCRAPARADHTVLDVLGTNLETPVVLDCIRPDNVGTITTLLFPSWFHGYCYICVQLTENIAPSQQVSGTYALFSSTLPMSTSMDTIRETAHRLITDLRTRHGNAPRSSEHSLHVFKHSSNKETTP